MICKLCGCFDKQSKNDFAIAKQICARCEGKFLFQAFKWHWHDFGKNNYRNTFYGKWLVAINNLLDRLGDHETLDEMYSAYRHLVLKDQPEPVKTYNRAIDIYHWLIDKEQLAYDNQNIANELLDNYFIKFTAMTLTNIAKRIDHSFSVIRCEQTLSTGLRCHNWADRKKDGSYACDYCMRRRKRMKNWINENRIKFFVNARNVDELLEQLKGNVPTEWLSKLQPWENENG